MTRRLALLAVTITVLVVVTVATEGYAARFLAALFLLCTALFTGMVLEGQPDREDPNT